VYIHLGAISSPLRSFGLHAQFPIYTFLFFKYRKSQPKRHRYEHIIYERESGRRYSPAHKKKKKGRSKRKKIKDHKNPGTPFGPLVTASLHSIFIADLPLPPPNTNTWDEREAPLLAEPHVLK
jgi:hypothetical protein